MLVPQARWQAYLLLLAGPLICWSRWPLLRKICGLPVNAFVCLNVFAQLACSLLWGLLLAPAASFWHGISLVIAQFDHRVAAVVVGGFLLVHGDHLSSVAMQRLQASHAYLMYAGFTMGMGTLLNELIEPVGAPLRLAGGVAFVFLAIGCLGLRVAHAAEAPADTRTPKEGRCSSTSVDDAESGVQVVSSAQMAQELLPERQEHTARARVALGMCIVAGLCSMGWSPLSTLAAKGAATNNGTAPYGWAADSEDVHTSLANPFVAIFLFVGGELLGVPSVVYLGSRLDHTSLREAFRPAGRTHIAAGLAAGVAINLGYLGYFLAASLGPDVLPSTTVFAVAACNPIVSLIAFEAWQLRATRSRRGYCRSRDGILTCASIIFYILAITLLAV
ncbi:hypothetical protein AB1Y20_011424 [Prymnesium parvum]|uniref:Uncharacterized protein n=1 Tax=Prymnesium parvum TaxID=97485 RepID=A0AB34IPB6_PRYPA